MQTATGIALAAIGLLGIAVCVSAPAAADTAADEAALRAADQTFMHALYSTHDLDTIVALYAEDAVLMPADAPAIKGREAIRKYYAAAIATEKPGDAGTILESTQGVSGNLGWSSGRAMDTAAGG